MGACQQFSYIVVYYRISFFFRYEIIGREFTFHSTTVGFI